MKRLVTVIMAGSLVLAGCGGPGGTGADSGGAKDVFVWGLSAEPIALDPFYVSEGESLRVARQMYEGLVGTEPGGTKVVPALATKWDTEDSKTWEFTLKDGVKFHDGTPFNAEAACWNFERWYNFSGDHQNPALSQYWQTVFGGFKKNETEDLGESLYKSCKPGEGTVTIELSRPSASFIAGLSLPSFSMVSPDAVKKYGDEVSMKGDNPEFTGKFTNEHPTGTGPYQFKSWQRNDRITLERFDGYHGDKAKVKTVIVRTIPDGPARRQALENGEIDGYDQVEAGDVSSMESAGLQVQPRDAINVGYVGFNQVKKPLDNKKIRQAIAHALNREALVKAKYPPGSEVAHSMTAPSIEGYNPDVTKYEYNVDKAKQLIKDSGVANPEIELAYPTQVTRPYMPDPKANFEAFKADLEKAGFKVKVKSEEWQAYIDSADNGEFQVFLLGWNYDYADADNLVGNFFQQFNKRFGFRNQKVFDMLTKAETEPEPAERAKMYSEANAVVMDEVLPVIPYVHTKSFVGLAKDISGFQADPLSNERFATVTRK